MKRLKPLRRRFIIINMITITALLVLIFALIIGGNIQHNNNIAVQALNMLIEYTKPMNQFIVPNPAEADRFQDANRINPPDVDQNDSENTASPPLPTGGSILDAQAQKAANALPGILVLYNKDTDTYNILFSRNMDTSKSTAQKLAKEVLESGKAEGNLSAYKLTYLVRETPEGTKIAFVDRAPEAAALMNLLIACLAGFFLAWGLFFIVVWRLSLWAFRPIEEAWHQQRQFIADASHELKTPLTVILANMHILKSHPDSTVSEQIRWVDSSNQEALRMKKLVADMLILARNDAREQMLPANDTIALSDLVTGTLLSFEAVALEHGSFIEEHISPDLALTGDPAQLQELVNILLDNACKYAPANSTITVNLYQQDKKLHLTVHNQSVPLSDDTLKHLFERFYRSDLSRTRETGGYGLGLAIADSICQCHQGSITAYNDNDGITFHITLPIKQKNKK